MSSNQSTIRDATSELDTAINRIVGPKWVPVNRCTTPTHKPHCACGGTQNTFQPSTYHQLKEDAGQTDQTGDRGQAKSRPPLWVDAIDWITSIDTLATQLAPTTGGDTTNKLNTLATTTFAPEQADWVYASARALAALALSGETLIEGNHIRKLDVVAPCPQCEQSLIHRKDTGGDIVRKAALQLTVNGCQCIACGARWDKDHLHFLADLLQCNSVSN